MKFNTRLKAVAAAAALISTAFGANAATYDLGSVTGGAPTSFNASVIPSGPFSDIFTFSLSSSSSVGFNVINFPVSGFFNSVITSASLFSNTDGQLFNGDDSLVGGGVASNNKVSLTTGPLAAGSYYLNVTGIANGPQGGLYNGAVSVAAVPEPETYAMLLAGMGVMGFIARRRNKTSK